MTAIDLMYHHMIASHCSVMSYYSHSFCFHSYYLFCVICGLEKVEWVHFVVLDLNFFFYDIFMDFEI